MRLSLQLVAVLVVAAVLPLVFAGAMLTSVSRGALEDQVRAAQLTAAEGIARSTDRWLSDVLTRLELSADLFDLANMDDAARVGALRIVYRQLDEADIVALHDEKGEPVVPAVHLGAEALEQGHLPVEGAELAAFLAAVPLTEAREQGLAIGAAYLSERKHTVLLPVAVRLLVGGRPWTLSAELNLRPVQALVARVPPDQVGTAFVSESAGRVVAHPDGKRFLSQVPAELAAVTRRRGRGGVTRLLSEGEAMLAAAAPLERVGWTVVVEQSEGRAFRAVREMVGRTGAVLAVALLFAVGGGLLLSRRIARPIAEVARGARAIAGGELEHRLAEEGGAEVRELATSFNAMTAELARSRAEIEAFNEALKRRVAERTAELKKAQAELLQSRKLAAIGELGAGVAHELNNPLTGILGMSQLLLRRHGEGDADRKLLLRIEEDAKRCREVTLNLLRFSEQSEETVLARADANEIVRSATTLQTSLVESKGLSLETRLEGSLPPVMADAAQLQQVLLNILSNAVTATGSGGRITVETAAEGGFVQIRVLDTGRGIPRENLDRIFEPFFTTKEDWRGAGLGLSVAYQIVQAHHGTLEVHSEVGQGSTFVVSLPFAGAARAAS